MFSKSNIVPDPLAKKERRRRFWRKFRKFTFWTLALLFVVHSSVTIYGSILVNREYAYIRAKGDPIQFAELEPPQLPPDQNAATFYKRAFDTLKLTSAEKDSLYRKPSRLDAADLKTIDGAVRENWAAIGVARQAGLMPKCRFPLDWKGNPIDFDFPYYRELRDLVRLLAARASLEARTGDTAGALLDVRAGFGLTRHLSNEPNLIGFLVAQAIDSIAHRGLATVLENAPMTVTQAKAFDASLPKVDWAASFRHSLVGERMMGIHFFESMNKGQKAFADPLNNSSDDGSKPDEANEGSGYAWIYYPLIWAYRPFLKMDEVQTLRSWKRMLDTPAANQTPQPPNFGQMQDKANAQIPLYAILTRTLLPVFSRAGDNRDRAEVRRRESEVALALTCYRTAHGAYPATLSEAAALWGKPLPLDPYSDEPFHYERDVNSFSLYSIGVNRSDDKGFARRFPNLDAKADDQVWLNSSGVKLDTRPLPAPPVKASKP